MSRPTFLVDEDTHSGLGAALRQVQPTIDVIKVGDPGAPALHTLDPDLLVAAEGLQRILVTRDKSTMPGHLIDHFAAGRHTAGVIMLRQGATWPTLVQELVHQWATTEAADWVDRTIYLP
jgi:hypothetical protein